MEEDKREDKIKKAIRRRKSQEKAELRRLILTEARALFLKEGYGRFSMRKLAERIGYSPAAIYLYFRDKDDVLFTIVDKSFTLFRDQLRAAYRQSEDPWSKLGGIGEAYIRFGLEHPDDYRLMFMQRTDFLLQEQQEGGSRIESFDVLEDAVRCAMEEGVMERGDAGTRSDALWAAMHGVVSLAITMPMFDEHRTRQLTDHVLRMIYQAFGRT